MPLIEYSPNGRASCESCYQMIQPNEIRVGSKHRMPYGDPDSGYSMLYWHAKCYTNRKNFTKLYGFYNLKRDDQYRLLKTDEERQQMLPEEHTKRLYKKQCTEELKRQQQVPRRTTGLLSFVIQGLQASPASVELDQWMTLKRADTSLDPTAIFVHTLTGISVGHVELKWAKELAPQLEPSNTYFAQVKGLSLGGNDNEAICLIDFSKSTQAPPLQPHLSMSPIKKSPPPETQIAQATSPSARFTVAQVAPPASPEARIGTSLLPVTPIASMKNPYSRQSPAINRYRVQTTAMIETPKSPVLNSPRTSAPIKNSYTHQTPTTPQHQPSPLQAQQKLVTRSKVIAKPRRPVFNSPVPINNPYARKKASSSFETPARSSACISMLPSNRVPTVTPGVQTTTPSVVATDSKLPVMTRPISPVKNPYAHKVLVHSASPAKLPSSPLRTQPTTTPSSNAMETKPPAIKNPYTKTKATPSATVAASAGTIQNPYSARRSDTPKDGNKKEAFHGVNFTIVGRQHYPNVTFQKEILLERDRNNQHDPLYAICVRDKVTGQVGGHIPKSMAKKLAKLFDAYPRMIEGKITGPDTGFKVPARFEWPEEIRRLQKR